MSLTFRNRRPPRSVLIWMCVAAWAAVAMAWTAQHRFDMQPCPWCILQRILFMGIGAISLLPVLLPVAVRWTAAKGAAVLIVVLALGGVAAAAYQNLYAAKSSSCALSLADRIVTGLGLDRAWPDMFEVRASCAEAAVKLLGVPFELWSLGLFLLLAWGAMTVLRR
jgi:protein dithiol:quinone oxidoreductase